MYKKRAQTATGAMWLIILIAVFIILYIILLPPKERQELIGENGTQNNTTMNETYEKTTLLLEHPGTIDYILPTQMTIEHTVPSMNLYTIQQAKKLFEINSIYIKRAMFAKEFKNITFKIKDIEHTSNVLFSSNIGKGSGRLIIYLNGKEIFDKVPGQNIAIKLLKDYLKQGNNSLYITVSSPGLRFWAVNYYTLKDLKITADITDISKQKGESTFIISTTEKDNIEKSSLKYFVDCNQNVGKLNISINKHTIFYSVPDCGLVRSIEFPSYYLMSGSNKIVFKAGYGSYIIDNILIKTELKKPVYPIYYFEINETLYNETKTDKQIWLRIKFTNDIDYKQAGIYINGILTHIDTTSSEYTKDITPFIREGNNAIEIRPQTTLNMIELRVFYKKI